jgi:hypothetical protein
MIYQIQCIGEFEAIFETAAGSETGGFFDDKRIRGEKSLDTVPLRGQYRLARNGKVRAAYARFGFCNFPLHRYTDLVVSAH